MTFAIGGRTIGPGAPCYVIAEIGVNHNGDAEMARQLIDAARAAGADAVKLQLFSPDLLATAGAPKAAYQKSGDADEAGQHEMLRRLVLDTAAVRQLKVHADSAGIPLLATPFDLPNLQLILELGLPAIKIGSGDMDNPILLRAAAASRLPLIVSTGMADLAEVETTMGWLSAARSGPVALLHCVSAYPAPEDTANLRAMETLAAAFGCPVGYSDHTMGTVISVAAVARGAAIIEKHLTLDCDLPGPDHRASLDPGGFTRLVREIRLTERALGDGRKEPVAIEAETRQVARRSLCVSRDLAAGETIKADSLIGLRPGDGIPVAQFDNIVNRVAAVPLKAGHQLTWRDIQ